MSNVERSIKPSISRDHMSMFFWKHLKEDIHALREFLSISFDDVILLMHLIAKAILDKSLQRVFYGDHDPSLLMEQQDREKWERGFSETYISPIIQVRVHRNIRSNIYVIITFTHTHTRTRTHTHARTHAHKHKCTECSKANCRSQNTVSQ